MTSEKTGPLSCILVFTSFLKIIYFPSQVIEDESETKLYIFNEMFYEVSTYTTKNTDWPKNCRWGIQHTQSTDFLRYVVGAILACQIAGEVGINVHAWIYSEIIKRPVPNKLPGRGNFMYHIF